MRQYTVVQHSAWTANQDPQFEKGLEPMGVTDKMAETVREMGGILFSSYGEADEACEAWMYPQGTNGLTPQARGEFSTNLINGVPLYLGIREFRG